mgnify:CR=1 FL=1|tara:strand:+ start:1956 stop:2153 length:198 start_codon:yes stop_codon:yes gene_type:complete
MEVIIEKNRCKTKLGEIYEIEGIEISKPNDKKVFYGKETSFYKACCPNGITSKGYILDNGKIMLT